MATLLEHGFGFDGTQRNITLALEIRGNEGTTDAIPTVSTKRVFLWLIFLLV